MGRQPPSEIRARKRSDDAEHAGDYGGDDHRRPSSKAVPSLLGGIRSALRGLFDAIDHSVIMAVGIGIGVSDIAAIDKGLKQLIRAHGLDHLLIRRGASQFVNTS